MNKAILKGRIQENPEARQTQDGKDFCAVRLATSEKTSGEWKYENHYISFWGKSAETALKFLKKGMDILVEGKIRTIQRDKDGQRYYYTNIDCTFFELCGSPEKKQNHNDDNF